MCGVSSCQKVTDTDLDTMFDSELKKMELFFRLLVKRRRIRSIESMMYMTIEGGGGSDTDCFIINFPCAKTTNVRRLATDYFQNGRPKKNSLSRELRITPAVKQ